MIKVLSLSAFAGLLGTAILAFGACAPASAPEEDVPPMPEDPIGVMPEAVDPAVAEPAEARDWSIYSPDYPEIVAHRGASWDAPENTVPAYELAWEMGAHAVETDVYLSADGKVVCMHDRSLRRTTGVDANIDELTWDELRELDAGSWKGEEWEGVGIPLLSELMALTPPHGRFFVDVKSGPDSVPAIVEVIRESGIEDQTVIIAFSKAVCDAFVEHAPDLPVKWLVGTRRDEETGEWMPIDTARVQEAKDAGFTGLNVGWGGAHRGLVEASEEAGMRLYVWTVNELDVARRMVDIGASGITTDRPDIMLEEFHGGE